MKCSPLCTVSSSNLHNAHGYVCDIVSKEMRNDAVDMAVSIAFVGSYVSQAVLREVVDSVVVFCSQNSTC